MRIATAAMVGGLLATVVFAEQSSRPKFEVASIKPSNSGEHNGGAYSSPGGRFSARNIPLHFLIASAYKVKMFQVTGGPGWVDTLTWNIDAKAEGNPLPEQMMSCIQSLLEDRFRLQMRRRTDQHAVYNLLLAKAGPKLKPSTADCTSPGVSCGWSVNNNDIRGTVSMTELAGALSEALELPVVDKTGIQGSFDVQLHWAQEPAAPDTDATAKDPGGSSIFTAIQEQLGLRLESGRGPVEMLVIEHVEQPSEN